MPWHNFERSVSLHLSQYVLNVVSALLNWMSMHPFIGGHNNLFIFRIALDLLLDIAPIICTPVVTSVVEID
jgi:hypothetical protein